MHAEEMKKVKTRRDAFARIAFWQTLAFVFCLCFVWANEILDLPHLVFDASRSAFNPYRAWLLTAVVMAAGIFAVGYTYEQQRGILRHLLRTCMYCHRVQTPDGTWEHVEEYFIRHYPVPMERVACAACEEMLVQVNKDDGGRKADAARK